MNGDAGGRAPDEVDIETASSEVARAIWQTVLLGAVTSMKRVDSSARQRAVVS